MDCRKIPILETFIPKLIKSYFISLLQIKDLQNDHIVRFLGACIDPPHMCILTEYCQKGSLQVGVGSCYISWLLEAV